MLQWIWSLGESVTTRSAGYRSWSVSSVSMEAFRSGFANTGDYKDEEDCTKYDGPPIFDIYQGELGKGDVDHYPQNDVAISSSDAPLSLVTATKKLSLIAVEDPSTHNKVVPTNFSISFICEIFQEAQDNVLPCTCYVFENETKARAYSKVLGLDTKHVGRIELKVVKILVLFKPPKAPPDGAIADTEPRNSWTNSLLLGGADVTHEHARRRSRLKMLSSKTSYFAFTPF